ncbi:superoxide dismutase family protein [Mycobacterium genavense]|uniref:superoxide dismutase family protein n=1 Tax=Mycobacterium genavense TaxID=36812 RepID=UPI000471183B|nr:superoxide dismutase family protein [Mycobacterium genavense]
MKTGAYIGVAALTIASLAACANQQGNQASTSSSTSAPPGTERMATQLKSADGTQVGTATIDFANGYATVTADAGPNQVLSPGFHALMIHAVGRCEAPDFESAGSVYQAADHTGFPTSSDLTASQVRSDGSAKLVTTTTNLLTAADLRNSSGSALIVHQAADNLTNPPTSESGKRVACGVITAASASSTSPSTTTSSVSTVTTTAVVPAPSVSTSTITVTSTPTGSSVTTPTTTTRPSLPPGT